MTVRQSLQRDVETLKGRYSQAMKGRLVPSPKALSIQREIIATENKIKELDREAAERLALEKAPVDEVLEVIAIPLLADVLNDLIAGVNGMLRKHGVSETVFGDYAAQIKKNALAIVNTLSVAQEGLPNLLDVNDALIDAIKKKLMSFIKQRLNVTK